MENLPDDACPVSQPAPNRDLGRVPPQAIEAEICVLGSMMLDAACIDIVVQIVRRNDFYRPAHQLIFQAIVDMRHAIKPIDLVTVRDEMDRRKQLGPVGGVEYIVSLADGVPNAANAEYYAKTVRDKAMLRNLIVAGTAMIRDAFESTDTSEEIVNDAYMAVTQIVVADNANDESIALSAAVREALEYADKVGRGDVKPRFSTGYKCLDQYTDGIGRGELLTIGAAPSVGKSSLVQNMIEGNPPGTHCLLVTSEMKRRAIAYRMLQIRSQVPGRLIRNGKLTEPDQRAVAAAALAYEEDQVAILDVSATTEKIGSYARLWEGRWHAKIDIIYIDYLGLMAMGRESKRYEQFGDYVKRLKNLAVQLDCAVVLLSQLNRDGYRDPNVLPNMASFRESGEIEAHSDFLVALAHPPTAEFADPDPATGRAIMASGMLGPTPNVTGVATCRSSGPW